MSDAYDSRQDTIEHILRVRELLYIAQNKLEVRGLAHDQSKLQEPEKSTFDACTAKLKAMVYGSDEYKAALAELKPALDHHYAANSHHPEHFGNGVDGMSLLDLLEMLIDWKAATERMKGGGDIWKSLEINKDRFKLSPQLFSILVNTAQEMGWKTFSGHRCETCQSEATVHIEAIGFHFCASCLAKIDAKIAEINKAQPA